MLAKAYIPALDGIRAAAVLLVVMAHFDVTGGHLNGAGALGVDIFFALSGYLITSILISEWTRTGSIKLSEFYRRRIFRIWPAFILLLAIYCVLFVSFSSHGAAHFHAALSAALSYMNWSQALWNGPDGFVGHAWSLSIEEQFYLIWPPMLLLLLKHFEREVVVRSLLAILTICIVWRFYIAGSGVIPIRLYAGTDTHADPILIGCLLAAVRLPSSWRRRLTGTQIIPWLCLAGLSLIPAWSVGWFTWEFTATGLLSAWILIGATSAASPAILSTRLAAWIGKRSYSLYLWHVPVLKILNLANVPLWERALIGIPVAVLLAMASYTFIEVPFLRLKNRSHIKAIDVGAGQPAAA